MIRNIIITAGEHQHMVDWKSSPGILSPELSTGRIDVSPRVGSGRVGSAIMPDFGGWVGSGRVSTSNPD